MNELYEFDEEDAVRLGSVRGISKSPQTLYMDPGQYVESSIGKDKNNVSLNAPNNGFSIKQRISAIAVAVLAVLCCVPVITIYMCKKYLICLFIW